jgi:hypothetical protein
MRLKCHPTAVSVTVVAALVIWSAAAVPATETGALLVAPAADGGLTHEVPVRLSVHRDQRSTTKSELTDLNLLPADASGAITILVESVDLTGDTPTADDNDYTRIDNAVQAVTALGDGTIVRLMGTFDWSEPHALASWEANDYAILAPTGVADVTIHAPELGNAVIEGPGELADPDVYYEAFLFMWGGLYQGWTIENLVIRGFDWSIGMFYDGASGGSTEDFNGMTVRNNVIEVNTDLPGNFDPSYNTLEGEPWQNIALHLGFGENQTIEGNQIVIDGSCAGVPYEPDPERPQLCGSVALQSNTSNTDAYDGLRIVDNSIRITGAQAAIPERIYGIWENSGDRTSDIEVSGNSFVNEDPGNDPALNFQRAFRVTTHSSDTTTVTYADNLVVGANIAIHWIGDNYTSYPKAGMYPVIVEGNTLLGNDTGVWVHTDGLSKSNEGLASKAELTDLRKATLRFNRIVGNTVGVRSDDAEVMAENNWWGCNEGPGAPGCDAALWNEGVGFLDAEPWLVLGVGTADQVVDVGHDTAVGASVQMNSDAEDLGAVGFPSTDVEFSAERGTVPTPAATVDGAAASTFTGTDSGIGSVTASLDNAEATANLLVTDGGVVGVQSVDETGDTPTLVDNDYTRINNLVQMVGDDVTILLEGTFDWTESFANIAWSLGSDGIADTDDDYSIAAPPGFENVTIGAAALGDAVIQGPGDVPTLDWETFLGMWDGSYFGWTVENLDIRGFDWSIAMFFTTGADFHGVTIRNNLIMMPADEPGNYGANIGEPWQNVAIHMAGGQDQTVEGNEIIIPGSALSDTTNPAVPLKAASVALQSNTHGGDRYDGLRIIDNLIRITGAQSADPEWVYGIWENGHAHASDIEVSGNSFVNENPANDPALNLQRAFRVTSHSSDTTTVVYGNNLVEGANIGIHWIGDNYTSKPPSTVMPVVVQGNVLLGNETAVWVHTDDLEPPGESAAAKFVGTPYMSKAVLRFNRIAGNAVGVRSDDAEVGAEDNWWGCNEGPNSPDCDSAEYSGSYGFLDADTWVELGLSAVPDLVQIGATSAATAVFASNAEVKNGLETSPVPDGTPVFFSATGGVMAPANAETLLGMAASTYSAGMVIGDYQVSATVDSEMVGADVEVVAWADLAVVIEPAALYLDHGEQSEIVVTVTNDGPAPVLSAGVVVDFPTGLGSFDWTCAAVGGGVCTADGSGDIGDSVDLPVGASVVYTAAVSAPNPFHGRYPVAASVAAPAGVVDTDLDNNSVDGEILAIEIFVDGFESGDTSAWSSTVGLAP